MNIVTLKNVAKMADIDQNVWQDLVQRACRDTDKVHSVGS